MSTDWPIKVSVTYDPPVIKVGLEDSTVNVGKTIKLQAPLTKNSIRGNQAVISSPGLAASVPFGSLND